MIYDLIIVGSDAAGLTAGIYAGRKRINSLILTKKLGGQSLLSAHTENYPGFSSISGAELISRMKEQVEKFNVPFQEGAEVTGLSKRGDHLSVKTAGESYEARAVIIASGRRAKELGVPGEREFKGNGVSVCAICDAPFFEGKDVAVVGGGDAAFESAYDLLSYAKKIYVLHYKDEFAGDKVNYEKLIKSGKVDFLKNAKVKEIKGSKFVEMVIYDDQSGPKELKISGVFINIGQIPNSELAEGFLELNQRKEIIIDPKTNETSVNGVFAAGDVTDIKYKQSIIAAAEGAKALLSAHEYLKKNFY